MDLAGLQADGGVRGTSIESRVRDTAILLLITTAAAKAMPGVYEKHLDKMVAFLEANKKAVNGQAVALHKAIMAAKRPAVVTGTQQSYEALFGKPDAQVWDACRAAV